MAAYTAQQLADIKAAYATGARVVDTPNMRTEFRSLDEMERIIRSIESDVTGTPQVRTSLGSYSKD